MLVRAFIDADTLYRRHVRNQLTWQALEGVFALCWSPKVLAEAREHLVRRNLKKLGEAREGKVDEVLNMVTASLEHAGAGHQVAAEEVAAYEAQMTNHPKDRHVLAAAVAAEASVVITSNTKDFKQQDTGPWGITAMTADAFLVRQLKAETLDAVTAGLEQQADFLGQTLPELLDLLGSSTDRRPAFLPLFVGAYEERAGFQRAHAGRV